MDRKNFKDEFHIIAGLFGAIEDDWFEFEKIIGGRSDGRRRGGNERFCG